MKAMVPTPSTKSVKVSIIRTLTARLLKCHTGVVLDHYQIVSQCIKTTSVLRPGILNV
jgi:hypothetical protein